MVSDPDIAIKEKAAADPDRKVTFVDLVPGRLYNITLWTVSGGVTSRPLERQERLYPEQVTQTSINASKITDTQIDLVWDVPNGDYDSFEVMYQDDQGRLIQNLTYSNSINIGRLRPYRNYTFTIVTKAGTDQSIPKRSTTVSASFSTRESVPGSLTSFEPIDVLPSSITFRWDLPPVQANGIITGFTIQWGPKAEIGKPFIPEDSRKFGPLETQGTITGLLPGEKYTFQIQARTRIGFGPKETKEQKMPILAPPAPARTVFPTEIARSMHTITIRFRKNYFSDKNGKVLGYTILVAEDHMNKHTEGDAFLPGWRDVQKFSAWPPYQVILELRSKFDQTFLCPGHRSLLPVQQQFSGGLHRKSSFIPFSLFLLVFIQQQLTSNSGWHRGLRGETWQVQWQAQTRHHLLVQGRQLKSSGRWWTISCCA